jgi:broad specificity phosphatase PhoE
VTTIYLVRHAKAGSRRQWKGNDELRPLSKAGRTQARALAKRLSGAGVARIVSSPYVRCRETVEPLADKSGVELEVSDALAEGATRADSLRFLEKCAGDDTVLCTHGDVLGNLLMHASHLGVDLGDDRIEKASVWVLQMADGEVRSAHYEPPPGT